VSPCIWRAVRWSRLLRDEQQRWKCCPHPDTQVLRCVANAHGSEDSVAGKGAPGAAVRISRPDPAMNTRLNAPSIADLWHRLQALGDRDGARLMYWESLYQDPLRWEIHNNLAMVERELGHYADARRLAQLSIRVNSQCEHCFMNLVSVYTAQGTFHATDTRHLVRRRILRISCRV
jgi:hypothetical protein